MVLTLIDTSRFKITSTLIGPFLLDNPAVITKACTVTTIKNTRGVTDANDTHNSCGHDSKKENVNIWVGGYR